MAHNSPNTKCTNKKWILKPAREKDQAIYKDRPTWLFSGKIKGRKAWTDVLQTLRDHRGHSRLTILHLAKSWRSIYKGKKASHNKAKFKQFLPTNPALQKALKEKFSLKRLTPPKKTQGITYLRTVDMGAGHTLTTKYRDQQTLLIYNSQY